MPKAPRTSKAGGLSAEERAAVRERARELRARKAAGDGELDVLAKIAAMPEPDRALATRLHALVRADAPTLTPQTWYGMPAYAREGKVVCFFQSAHQFKSRYCSLGFADAAHLDDGDLWPVAFALKAFTPAVEAKVRALVAAAAGPRPAPAPDAPATLSLHADTRAYHAALAPGDRAIAERLAGEIARHLPEAENKIWHRHPVWFLEGNPIVGYSRLRDGMRLLFWSGQSFDEPGLTKEGTFKAAEIRYATADAIDPAKLGRWLTQARTVQWDYQHLARRKGRLERRT